jgi:hypothetical protein
VLSAYTLPLIDKEERTLHVHTGRRLALSAALSVGAVMSRGARLPNSAPHQAHIAPPQVRQCSAPPQSQSATRVIGPMGGALRFGDNVLEIPAGALDSAVSITAMAPQSQYLVVDLSPHGLRFAVPASLSMGYGPCGWSDSAFHVDYLSDDLTQVLEEEPSSVDTARRIVQAPINHFSLYAVAEGYLPLPVYVPPTPAQ